ncbi:MAG TPA: DEAD/DEAH box helicase [Verrucomicrobiales bacterium]|nr:DEAD/DEAH box helicase [Verrucomicrobiales bacterium]
MSLNSSFQGLEIPDPWQQEAVSLLRSGHDVIIDAPTGAGKTRIFELLTGSNPARAAARSSQSVFAVPTRALANDKYHLWKNQRRPVGLLTGDVAVDAGAPILVATLETQRERLLRGQSPALLAIDEYQMLGNADRGVHYETALALAQPTTRLLLLSGSVANPADVSDWLTRLGRCPRIVASSRRPVPLEDLPVESLPTAAPRGIKGFFPRLAAEVLLAGLAPLLIFAPQRHTAESIARKIADALPPPRLLELNTRQIHSAGKSLARLLQRRVAYHHSGMSYLARAGLVEPLARAGQLRVVVATMGLASGIDFSVRSTFVASSSYFDGPYLHELQPDELLQMFGRAGRRGRDEFGYALSSSRSPRLSGARPMPLVRPDRVDWPAFLRIMHAAAAKGANPLQAAQEFSALLFRREPPALGMPAANLLFRQESPPQPSQTPEQPFLAAQDSLQILNHRRRWETRRQFRADRPTTAGAAFVRAGSQWIPCLDSFRFVAALTRLGQVCRLADEPDRPQARLGKELLLAHFREGQWRLARKLIRPLAGRGPAAFTGPEAAQALLENALSRLVPGARIHASTQSGDRLLVRLDLSACPVHAYRDRFGVFLLDPPIRNAPLDSRIFLLSPSGARFLPPPGSPLRAWRELDLIAANGDPTRRGLIASFYQHGEGLAIAAALEQEDYEAADLALHIANLRGGHRFASSSQGASERLASACRDAYGSASHAGYLTLGLPDRYGEGAAEALEGLLDKRVNSRRLLSGDVGQGDLERACREWINLLRHTVSAAPLPWGRWIAFQQAAAQLLDRFASDSSQSLACPSLLDASQLQGPSHHFLSLRDFHSSPALQPRR